MIKIKSGSDFLGRTLDNLAEAILELSKNESTNEVSRQLYAVLVYLENVYLQVQDFIKKNDQPAKKKVVAPKKPVPNPFAKKPVKAVAKVPVMAVKKVAPKVVKKAEVKKPVAKTVVKKPAPVAKKTVVVAKAKAPVKVIKKK